MLNYPYQNLTTFCFTLILILSLFLSLFLI
nr:MAG TPA: hypothetical protein [Caudoviricetes sp.]